jgi:hypothetical protein
MSPLSNQILLYSGGLPRVRARQAAREIVEAASRSERRLDLVTEESRLLLSVKQKDLLNHSSL